MYLYRHLHKTIVNGMDRFESIDIKVFDAFIEKFAERYINQRSGVDMAVLEKASSINCGLDTEFLLKTIRSKSVYIDPCRESGNTPPVFSDIYRSDLGELLTTYYFEEKLPEGERFIIPLKNISTRERYDMPGRGPDALGYRIETDGTINLLLSETKVSEQKASPPSVVDASSDSIYKTQKMYHDDEPLVLQRLTEYVRHLSTVGDMAVLGCLVVMMSSGKKDKYRITYGCGLIRDYTCVDKSGDFGKMKSRVKDFRPGDVHFEIFSFTLKTISETIDLFYKKVMELI